MRCDYRMDRSDLIWSSSYLVCVVDYYGSTSSFGWFVAVGDLRCQGCRDRAERAGRTGFLCHEQAFGVIVESVAPTGYVCRKVTFGRLSAVTLFGSDYRLLGLARGLPS
jgi:hypothetical protein